MSKDVKSPKYQGVYWRELKNGDKQYFLRMRRFGRVYRIPVGRASEGCNEDLCAFKYRAYSESQRFLNEVIDPQNYVQELDWSFEKIVNFYIQNRSLSEITQHRLKKLCQTPFAKSKRLTREQLQRYFNQLLKKKSPSTVRLCFRQIRAIMKYAINHEKYRFPDPTVGIDIPNEPSTRQRYLTTTEVRQLLEAVQNKPLLLLFVKMSLCTGARLSTIVNVQRKDIHEDGSVDLYNTKCRRWYKGFLDEETMALVKSRQGYIFSKKWHQKEKPPTNSIQRSLQNILNKLFNTPDTPKLKRVVVHTLRHSVATQQIRKGVPLEVVSKTLDHSSITVTSMVYAKVVPEMVQKAVANLWE